MNQSIEDFLDHKEDGVYVLGHSSALIRLSGKLILCDPVGPRHQPYGHYWKFKPDQIDASDGMLDIEEIFISHVHSDHWDPTYLLNYDCRVSIMEDRPELLRALLEYTAISTERPNEWIACPSNSYESYFMPHPHNTIDSAIVLRNEHMTIFHGNDCFLDEASCLKLKRDVGNIDVALLPFQFVHSYPYLLDGITEGERESEIERLNKQCLDQAKMFCEILQPKHVVPFGGSLFHVENDYLNSRLSRPHDLNVANNRVLVAGGFILKDGTVHGSLKRDEYERIINMEPILDIIRERVSRSPLKIPGHRIYVNGIEIDLFTLEVKRTSERWAPLTQYVVHKIEFQQWLMGRMTFEQVIGSRRFRYKRIPNEYNLQVHEFTQKYL